MWTRAEIVLGMKLLVSHELELAETRSFFSVLIHESTPFHSSLFSLRLMIIIVRIA